MPRYLRLGDVPRKRHTQFRKPDGTLYSEQVFGTRGFSGIASILYHLHPPTAIEEVALMEGEGPHSEFWDDGPLRPRHFRTRGIPAAGDAVSGRVPLLANADVAIGLCRPVEAMAYFYKNA